MINLYQQRDFGEKINATFNYAVSQFRSLGLALLYIAGPVTLVAGIAGGIYQSNILKTMGGLGGSLSRSTTTNPFAIFDQMLSPTYGLMLLFTLLSYVLVSLTVYSHMKLYARNFSEPISVAAVWQEVQRNLIGGIGLTLVTGAAVFAALIVLIIPGLYISVPLSLALAVMVFEGANFGAVFSRCFKLITDKWWSTFGLIIVMSIIAAIMGLVFSVPAAVLAVMGITGKEVSSLPLIITQAVAIIGTRLLSAIVPMALGFQYFNLVERQEGTGLLSAIDKIGTTPPPTALTPDEGY